MHSRRSTLLVLALLACTACAVAQPPAAPAAQPGAKPAAADLPSGEALFAKHVEALGGMEALRSQKSAMIKGRMTLPSGSVGLITVWRKAPDRMYRIIDIPGTVTVETWCDGESAWMRNSNKGAARLTGDALTDTKLESEFIGEADYKARYKELKTIEKTTFGDRPAYAVAATTAAGKARTLFFDAEKGFLIGVKLDIAAPRGDEHLTLTFGDYKKCGATWQPTLVVEDTGQAKTTTTFSQIEMDVAVLPSLDPPDEVRNLK